MRQARSAQAMTEYMIGASLIAVISIGALFALGNNLDDLLKMLLPAPPKTMTANAGKPISVDVAAPPVSNIPDVAVPPTSPTGANAVSVSDYSGSLTSIVSTVGANGATSQLAAQLVALAAKLKESGQISDEEANKLVSLANQGFRLADLERSVEEASKTKGSTQAFLQSSINFDGKTYTIPEVAGLIGFGSPTDLTQDIQNNSNYMLESTPSSTAAPETLAFLNRYQDVINSPNIQNSEAQKVVSQLSSQISYLSDAVSNLIYGANDPNISLENLNKNTASVATVYDSHSICYLGGDACHR